MQLNSDKICWFHVIWINIYNYELITQKIRDEKKPSNLFYIQYVSVKFGEGNGNPLQYSCLEKPWRRRSLVGYNPWGHEELDTTERLHFHFSLSCTGEGHGNPLQCSCLENPRDRGAWWAAVYWVAQSQTWLTRLSSISSTFKLDLTESQSGINHLWDGDTYWWVVTLQPSSIGPFITVKRQKISKDLNTKREYHYHADKGVKEWKRRDTYVPVNLSSFKASQGPSFEALDCMITPF